MAKMYIGIAVLIAACSLGIAAEKQLKQGEYEIYNQVLQDLRGTDDSKSLASLDQWSQKFPDSDYKDERGAFYVQSYAASSQPAKALDAASALMKQDLSVVFPAPDGVAIIVRLLYNVVWAVSQPVDLTQTQLETGAKARQGFVELR